MLGRGQTRQRRAHLVRLGRVGFGQRLGTRGDPQLRQELALRRRSENRRAAMPCSIGQGGEIQMGGEIIAAWLIQGRHETMRSHRLQRFAKANFVIAVIQNQSRAAVICDSARNLSAQRGSGGRGFIEATFGRAGACGGDRGGGGSQRPRARSRWRNI